MKLPLIIVSNVTLTHFARKLCTVVVNLFGINEMCFVMFKYCVKKLIIRKVLWEIQLLQ